MSPPVESEAPQYLQYRELAGQCPWHRLQVTEFAGFGWFPEMLSTGALTIGGSAPKRSSIAGCAFDPALARSGVRRVPPHTPQNRYAIGFSLPQVRHTVPDSAFAGGLLLDGDGGG